MIGSGTSGVSGIVVTPPFLGVCTLFLPREEKIKELDLVLLGDGAPILGSIRWTSQRSQMSLYHLSIDNFICSEFCFASRTYRCWHS